MTYNIDFDYIMSYISDYCDYLKLNEDNYYDIKHQAVDDYVSHFDYDMKELVNQYGFFKAIKLYTNSFGEYTIDDKHHDVRIYYDR